MGEHLSLFLLVLFNEGKSSETSKDHPPLYIQHNREETCTHVVLIDHLSLFNHYCSYCQSYFRKLIGSRFIVLRVPVTELALWQLA